MRPGPSGARRDGARALPHRLVDAELLAAAEGDDPDRLRKARATELPDGLGELRMGAAAEDDLSQKGRRFKLSLGGFMGPW